MADRRLLVLAPPDWPPWVPLLVGLLLAVGVGFYLLAILRRSARPENGLPYGGAEKRRAPRRRVGSVSVEVADADGTVRPYRGWVVDRSEGGLCLAVEESFPVGAILRVRPPQAGGLIYWVPLWVRHLRQAGTTWEVGCQFLQTVSATTLHHFG
jgi:hypothetical protein